MQELPAGMEEKQMIKIEGEFPRGYIRPCRRGIVLDRANGEEVYLDDLIESYMQGAYSPSGGTHLKGIKISITIEEAFKS